MDIKIDVKPEDIEASIKDAIIKSAIGKKIEEKLALVLSDYNLGKTIEDVLKHAIADQARQLIYKDEEVILTIKQKIVEKLNTEFIDGIANKIARAIERDY